jgi:1,4-dihydroxy-2-naphthoate octaprenyltransferase
MFSPSTIRLLRIPFSFFLSPVFFFALGQVADINWRRSALIFIILHFFIYPASNGYNSFMDRDTGSIGGLEKPPQPEADLFNTTIALDITAMLLSILVSPLFAGLIPFYIAASKAYSWRGLRLKQYPVIGYLTVIIFQGAFTFWLVYYGASEPLDTDIPWRGLVIVSLLIGVFYPLTQIYQHQQDLDDGVETISYKLGYRGTFIFCSIIYILAWFFMAEMFFYQKELGKLFIVSIFFVPVIVYFIKWFLQVNQNREAASFRNTMRMNWLASSCTNIAFIILLIWRWFE